MMKDKKKRCKGIVNRFKGILIKIIKDTDSRFDNYNMSPKIRQILLHWSCELKEGDLLLSYYWFNRKELLEKANKKYHKEGGKEIKTICYKDNKEAIKKEKEINTE